MKLVLTPKELWKHCSEKIDGIAATDFFNQPKHSKNQEIWCASRFSAGYDKFLCNCKVGFYEKDSQDDVDFELITDENVFPFQLTEAIEPGRKRGDEYRRLKDNKLREVDRSKGTRSGPDWIKESINRKIRKNYASAEKLNLLVYVNFEAWEHPIDRIRDAASGLPQKFASVWLLNDYCICSIYSNDALGYLPTWVQFPDLSE